MRKQEIKHILIDRLVEDELLDEFCLDHKVVVDDGTDNAVKLKQLEIQKKIELAKLQTQQQELDAKLQMEPKERQDRLAMEERIKTKEIEAKVQNRKR